MIHSKKRVGLATATAAATVATVFALPGTANAAAVPPLEVTSASATGGTNQITVSWTPALVGEPATSFVVVVFTEDGVQVGVPHVVMAPETKLTVEGLAAGKYFAEVYSHNSYPGYGGPRRAPGIGTVEVKDADVPDDTLARSTVPYRPYKNWDDMIDQEYRFWTGCVADTKAVAGRFPRDDEFTFWRQKLTGPINWNVGSADSVAYNAALSRRLTDEWGRLTNNATWTLGVNITSAGYKTSIAYKALYDEEYKRLTSIPSGGGFMPADNGWDDPGTIAADAGVANNNHLEADELLWARFHADLYATWPANLEAKYAVAVNSLANNQAIEDVYFARRLEFVKQLAEDAAQTDGPAYRLYTAYFSRIPDAKGLCFWTNALRGDWSLRDVSEFFVQSDEFVKTYGEYSTHGEEGAIDAAEFVSLVYRNVLEREADGAGAAFWTRQLQTERATPAEMLIGFSESQEFTNRMSTKVGSGIAFIHLLGRMPTPAEYVWADLYPATYFNPTPDTWWTSVHVYNSLLYEMIVDSWIAPGEYNARAGITIPAHTHPHNAPGSQPPTA